MAYHIDEQRSEVIFEVDGDRLIMKLPNKGGSGLDIYVIKEEDETVPSDNNLFSALRVLKEIDKIKQNTKDGFFELKTDSNGLKYIITKYPVVSEQGLTAYASSNPVVPSIVEGIPFDNKTIWYNQETKVVEVIGGTGGGGGDIDATKLWQLLSAATDEQINISHLSTALKDYTTTKKMWELLKGNTTEQINESHLTDVLKQYTKTEELSGQFVTTDETEQSISGIKDFTKGIKVGGQLINIVDGVLYLDCSIAVTGGITAYAMGDRNIPTIMDGIVTDEQTITVKEINGVKKLVVIGGTGGDLDEDKLWDLLGAEGIQQIDKSHLTTALNGYATTEQLNKKWTQDDVKISHWDEAYGWGDHSQEGYAHLANEEIFTGLKHFTKGLSVGSNKKKIYESNGVVYIDGDLAVTGGVTAYALGGRSISSIMDGVVTDNTTIRVNPTTKALEVIGGTGGGEADSVEWNNIKNIPTWITDTKPTYNWSEIKNTPTTLSGYGITDAFKIISGTPDTNKGMSAGYWDGIGSYASFVGNNWGGQFKMNSTETLSYRTVKNGVVGSWKTIAFTTSTIDNALHLNGKDLNYNSENPFGKIPFVATDGVMEVGRYIDFHYNSTETVDYRIRLQITQSTGSNTITIPSKGGTLALLTDNVASASKLETARKLWGQSFDGTKNIESTSPIYVDQMRDSGDNYCFASDGNGNVTMGTTGRSHFIKFDTEGGTKMYILNNGNVGIGTIGPTEKLEVKGNIITSGTYKTYRNNPATWGATQMLDYLNSVFSVSTQAPVGKNTCRNILSWCDVISGGVGYITRYAIGSIRENSGFGQLYLAVGNNDGGTSLGCALRLDGSTKKVIIKGDLVVQGNVLSEGGVTAYTAGGGSSDAEDFTVKRLNVVGTNNSNAYISADNASNMYFNWGNKTGLVLNANEVRCGLNMSKQISLGTATAVWKDLYINGLTVNSSPSLSDSNMTAIRTDINNAYFGLRHNGTNWYVQGWQGQLMMGPGGTKSIKIDVNGNMSVYGKVTESSDERLKSDIKPLANRGYIEPKTFVKDGIKYIGFIAQDVQKLYPELVVEDNTEEHYLSLSYSQYVAVLQAQIIELNERVKKLEKLNN